MFSPRRWLRRYCCSIRMGSAARPQRATSHLPRPAMLDLCLALSLLQLAHRHQDPQGAITTALECRQQDCTKEMVLPFPTHLGLSSLYPLSFIMRDSPDD